MAITAEIKPGYETILTREALDLVATLHRTFEPRRQASARRRVSSARSGSMPASVPDFLPKRKSIREGDWKIAPLAARRWNAAAWKSPARSSAR